MATITYTTRAGYTLTPAQTARRAALTKKAQHGPGYSRIAAEALYWIEDSRTGEFVERYLLEGEGHTMVEINERIAAWTPEGCPGCDSPLDWARAAMSRYDNATRICNACGMKEAMADYAEQRLIGPGVIAAD